MTDRRVSGLLGYNTGGKAPVNQMDGGDAIMRIAIGSDHAGFEQKVEIVPYLEGQGHEVVDMGPDNGLRVDYPDHALPVAVAVAEGRADRGILICGTGIGMAITADKVAGVRAANINNIEFAELSRRHNDLNVLCLSARFVDVEDNERIIDTFLTTPFDGGRHALRVAKVMALDPDALPEIIG